MVTDNVRLGAGVPAVHGRARVQLFDAASGRLACDVAHDNFVSPRWLEAMAWWPNWAAFAYRTTPGTDATTVMSGIAAFGKVPFGGLAITDYAGVADLAERVVRGNPLAHASSGVVGGGSYRGSYNVEESLHSFGYHKFVYDFATSQANGAFQSIYTGFFTSSGNDSPSPYLREAFSMHQSPWASVAGTMLLENSANGALYQCAPDAIYEVTDWTPIASGLAPTINKLADVSPVAAAYGYSIKADRMYWLTDGGSKQIKSAPLTNLADTRVEKSLDTAWAQSHGGTSSFYVTGFTYHPTLDVFVLSCTLTGSGAPLFAVLTLDPATLADRDQFGAGGSEVTRYVAAFPDEASLVLSTGGSNPKSSLQQLEGDGSLTTLFRSDVRLNPLTEKMMLESGPGSGAQVSQRFLAPGQLFFSRALLDAPVTKTVQNTMKITYEFTFDTPTLP